MPSDFFLPLKSPIRYRFVIHAKIPGSGLRNLMQLQDVGGIPFPEWPSCGGGRRAVQVWLSAVTAAVAVMCRCTDAF